jgi:hypothetical protein
MRKQKIIRWSIKIGSVFGICVCLTMLFPQVRRIIIDLSELYYIHVKEDAFEYIMSTLLYYMRSCIVVILVFDFFTLTTSGKRLCKSVYSEVGNCLKEIDIKLLFKPVLLLSGIYLLGISSILRANFLYIDDMLRTLQGETNFINWSRYLSEFLAIIVHADIRVTDISPLPQLLAVLIIAISSVLLVYIVCNKKISVATLLASIPVGLSPYFLECLSYKFDSPYMALSVLASIIPFLFTASTVAFVWMSVICLLIMCMTYQASSGIYALLVIIISFLDWNYKRKTRSEILRFILIAGFSFLCALIFFRLFFVVPKDVLYATTDMFTPLQFFSGVSANLTKYVFFIYHDFGIIWKVLIGLVSICFVVQATKTSKQRKEFAFVMSLLVLIVSFVLSYGIYLVLKNPIFHPRALYGFGIFLAIFMVFLASYCKRVITIIVFALSWSFFVFTLTYGNALFEQKRYIDFRTEMLLKDLSDLFPDKLMNDVRVQIENSAGLAPAITKNIAKQYPVIKRLVPQYLGGDGKWAYFDLFNYYYFWDEQSINIKREKKIYTDFTLLDLPTVRDSYYQTIKSDGKRILIVLKHGERGERQNKPAYQKGA